MELLFSNMHPSITIYFNSPIHTLPLHNSFRWFHILHRPTLKPPCGKSKVKLLRRTIKKQYRRRIISRRFQLALMTCLKFTKLLLATFHNYLLMNACKLQLRDNTYTMIHSFSQNQFSSHLQISRKGTPVFD